MKQITEDTFIGYDNNGEEIRAEKLQRWAYNQLAAAPDMYGALREVESFIKRRTPECLFHLGLVEQALAKAEGK